MYLITKEPDYVLTFGLTQSQQDKIDAWLADIEPRPFDFAIRQQLGLPTHPPFPTLEYAFASNGIGVSLTVRELHTGQSFDATEYDNW